MSVCMSTETQTTFSSLPPPCGSSELFNEHLTVEQETFLNLKYLQLNFQIVVSK